ncbi:MAG TPA: DUF86 domain-containing protein [Pseudogracilibacillus sp.]|nr:DUF86 domain-containing protein [Pseudogracilibacillus sp.]
MYFVNRSEIETLLSHMDHLLEEVKDNTDFQQNKLQQLALERFVQVVIETILDVGNKMIDGFIMRDPGSYHDIVDILIDEQVLPETDEKAYKTLIDKRQEIVREYHSIDHAALETVLWENYAVLAQFSQYIRMYLDNELGTANAFSNESKVENDRK